MRQEISTLSRVHPYKRIRIVTRACHLTPHSHCLPTPPPTHECSSHCADAKYPPENHLKDEAKSWREIKLKGIPLLIPEGYLRGLISDASPLGGVTMRCRVERDFFLGITDR